MKGIILPRGSGALAIIAAMLALSAWGFLSGSLPSRGMRVPIVPDPIPANTESQGGLALRLQPSEVSMRTVRAGGFAESNSVVLNLSAKWIEVTAIETSCPCLSVAPNHFRMRPGEAKKLTIRLDLSEEPD